MIGHFLTPFSRDHMTNCGKIHPSKKMRQASSNWLKVSQKVELIALCKVLFPRFCSWWCYLPGFILGSRKINIPDLFLPLPLSHSSPDCMHNIVNICFGKCKGAEHLGLVRNLCLMGSFLRIEGLADLNISDTQRALWLVQNLSSIVPLNYIELKHEKGPLLRSLLKILFTLKRKPKYKV